MTAKEVLKLLRDDGWTEYSRRGSHLKLRHGAKPGSVSVPIHKGDIPPGTLHSILKQAGLR